MFKIEHFDHMHVAPEDFEKFNEKFQRLMGMDYFMKNDMSEQYGTEVAFEPYPVGLEAFRVTDTTKSLSARIAGESKGVFCICYKVANLKEAIGDMESIGYKMLEYYDNAPILEALFDTKDDLGFYIELTEYPFESMRTLAEMQAG
ncbi:MAG: hypothetical protein Q4C91_21395 [Eubacteriales bacterium]|nr:hypothetical protein [Eubacteriales bacterium]